jgi:hypothetical protein
MSPAFPNPDLVDFKVFKGVSFSESEQQCLNGCAALHRWNLLSEGDYFPRISILPIRYAFESLF